MGQRSVKVSRLTWAGVLLSGLLLGFLLGQGPSPATAKEPPKTPPPSLTSDDGEIIRTINTKLAEGWKANKLTPSARANDYEFIRRATLDIIGRIAKPDEIQRFMKDPANTRRQMLIDRLLAHEDFAEHWSNIWTVLLMTRSGALDDNRKVYHEQMRYWLRKQFANPTVSWKNLVSELITATGRTNENQAVNFVLAHLGEPIPDSKRTEEGQFEMVPITSRVTRLFLGLQTQCTQCHDHPFNPEWKQSHFWGVNAFFRQVRREGTPAMRRQDTASQLTLTDNPNWNPDATVFYEKRNGVVLTTKPVFLDSNKVDLQSGGASRRQQLAKFLTGDFELEGKKVQFFPKAFVNRLWANFYGRGFTNPIDDFGEHNAVSHPELLEELASKFVHYGYDPRRLMRWICNSEAYNLTSVANSTNEKPDADPYFSRMLLKAMTPEQMFESFMVATKLEKAESESKKQSWMRSLTSNFGDDEGNEATFNGTVVQALLMMNGKDINDAISYKDKGTVALAFTSSRGNPSACLNTLYLAALNRTPTADESARILRILKTAPVKGRGDALAPWQDVFWALLNSNEFILNH